MTTALSARQETGMVINEHYSVEDYVRRRSGWLAKLPAFAMMFTGLFAIARRDAGDVFKHTREILSVQEVRRREQASGVDPLLPLPTIENTQTLDNFKSYGDCEWSPGVGWPVPRSPSIEEKEDDGPAPPAASTFDSTSQSPSSSPRYEANPRDYSIPDASTLLRTGPRLQSSAQTAPASVTQPANTNQGYYAPQQTLDIHAHRTLKEARVSSSSSTQLINSSPLAASTTSTAMTTPTSAVRGGYSNQAGEPPAASSTLIRDIINNLSMPAEQRVASQTTLARVGAGIASLAGRGIHVPVKEKRGKKRRASESDSSGAVDSVVDSEADDVAAPTVPPPRKKLKVLKGPRPPMPSSQAAPTPKSKTKRKPQPLQPAQTKQPSHRLDAVIDGTALPSSPGEARQAASTRWKRLLKQHVAEQKAAAPKRADRARKRKDPDLMPEFFNPDNFPAGAAGENEVRCVCGVVIDDGAVMISCDKCMVWQHNHCIGEALPQDMENDGYLCHVCDPWAHRVTIARLRRERTEGKA